MRQGYSGGFVSLSIGILRDRDLRNFTSLSPRFYPLLAGLLQRQGRVDATPGHYDDALTKGNIVHLLATESTGALSPDVIRLLRELAKTAQGTSGHDSTVYGLSRASPKSFFPHHLAAISSAIVCADARSIRNHAASLATQLSYGMI